MCSRCASSPVGGGFAIAKHIFGRSDAGIGILSQPPDRDAISATELVTSAAADTAGVRSARVSWVKRHRLLLQITDVIAIVGVLVLTYFWRFVDDGTIGLGPHLFPSTWVLTALGGLWMVALSVTESRSQDLFGVGLDEYRQVIAASLGAFGALAIGSYLAQAELSRYFFAVTLPIGMGLLIFGRWLTRVYLGLQRANGRALTPTVVIGDHAEVAEAVRNMRRHTEAGYLPSWTCLLDGPSQADPRDVDDVRRLPAIPFEDVSRLSDEGTVGAVLIAGWLSRQDSRRLAWSLEGSPVELLFVPRVADVAGPRMHVRTVEGLDLIQVDLPHFSGWDYRVKRAFDVVFSAAVLTLLSPLYAALAVAIKVSDGGPVFFRQERVGFQGEPFVIHKFRTMVVNAEEYLAELQVESTGNGALFKMAADPRVTRLGQLLRRTSLDELPQFWTVLRGSMAVVGPRPHLEHELAQFPDDGMRRLLIKPGITGLWQVNGRSELSLEDSLRLDLSYVENWSMTGDLAIILKTVRAMFQPRGAW